MWTGKRGLRKIPSTNVLEVGGISIYVLHNLNELDLKPEAAGFDVVVYGHSHVAKQETKSRVLYFNPGSAGPRRFRLPVTVGRLTCKARQSFWRRLLKFFRGLSSRACSAGQVGHLPLRGRLVLCGGAGGAGACPPPVLTRSFNSLLGLKNGIFFAGTSTRSPVFGLRPTRGLRWRVRKLPKPRISILSPTRSERTMLSKIVSTITSLSLRVSSASFETSSIRSAFVIRSSIRVTLSEIAASLRAEILYKLLKFQGFYASANFHVNKTLHGDVWRL